MSNQAGEINDLRWLRHIKDNLSKNNRLRALYSRGIVWDLSRQTLRFLDRMKLACDREEDNNSAVSPIWVRPAEDLICTYNVSGFSTLFVLFIAPPT